MRKLMLVVFAVLSVSAHASNETDRIFGRNRQIDNVDQQIAMDTMIQQQREQNRIQQQMLDEQRRLSRG